MEPSEPCSVSMENVRWNLGGKLLDETFGWNLDELDETLNFWMNPVPFGWEKTLGWKLG